MKKNVFFILLLVGTNAGGQTVSGADSNAADLVKNPEFKLNAKGKAAPWTVRCGNDVNLLYRDGHAAAKNIRLLPWSKGAAVPKVAIGLFASCERPKPVTFRWLLYE